MRLLSALVLLSWSWSGCWAAYKTRAEANGLCDGREVGEVLPSPLDCNTYVECSVAGALLRYCDAGLQFDAARKICNWPKDANCHINLETGHREEPVKQEEEESFKIPLPLPLFEDIPANKVVESDISSTADEDSPAPKEPSMIAIEDVEAEAAEAAEAAEEQASVTSEDGLDHSTLYPTFMAIDVNTGHITDPMSKYNRHHIECRHYGAYFLPHPSDCSQYFVCAYGHLHQHHCGMGTLWNYLSRECELSTLAVCYGMSVSHDVGDGAVDGAMSVVASADEHTITGISETTSYLPTTSPVYPPTVCYTVSTGLLSTMPLTTTTSQAPEYISSSSEAWTGYSPTPMTEPVVTPEGTTSTTVITTPTTTGAAVVTSTSPPMSSTTSSGFPSSTTPVSSSTLRSETEVLSCPRNRQAYLPHPKDCSKYYICIMGMPVLTSCPQGLRWDQKSEFCDAAKNVECVLSLN